MHRYNPDKCIACTMCLVACPVAEATHAFLGPRTIGPAFERFRPSGVEEDKSLALCSNCKNCDIACPHGVPVSSLNILAKAELYKNIKPSYAEKILANGESMARSAGLIPSFIKNFFCKNKLTRSLLERIGISRHALMPTFARKTFRQQLPKLPQPKSAIDEIILFPGCYMDIYDAKSSVDMVKVLSFMGYKVTVPSGIVCCGLPMLANGFLDSAKKNASKNAKVLSPYVKAKKIILTGCPSCALMFKEDIPELFPELGLIGSAVQDMQEFIFSRLKESSLHMNLPVQNLKAIYHAPCHLKAQGIGLPGLELLQKIKNLEISNANAGCCGISGSYGFKTSTRDIAMKVGQELFDTMLDSGASIGVSECGTCRLQMEQGTGMKTMHPLSLVLSSLQNGQKHGAKGMRL